MATLWLPQGSGARATQTTPTAAGVPVRFVVDSGLRPVVPASVEGVEVSMLVHANAGFAAMLTHDALHRITGRSVAKEREFGLGHDLRPSAAGRGSTDVTALEVGTSSLSGVHIEVFDLPTTNWQGMLGVDWLAATGATLDFGNARLFFPGRFGVEPLPPDGRRIQLHRESGSGRFTCLLAVEPYLDRTGRFVVSTVADTTLDIEFARQLGLELGPQVDEEHGPTGAVVPVHRPEQPLAFSFRGLAIASVRPSIYDIYAYGGNHRPADDSRIAGYVGADILLDAGAVVSFNP